MILDREAVTMRAATFTAAIAVFTTCLMSGCSSSESSAPPSNDVIASSSAPATRAPAPDIVISNFGYTVRGPVTPGQQVSIVNDDQASHSLASDGSDAFDVRVSGGGGISTLTAPMTPGTYEFHCKYHAGMHGTLTVR